MKPIKENGAELTQQVSAIVRDLASKVASGKPGPDDTFNLAVMLDALKHLRVDGVANFTKL